MSLTATVTSGLHGALLLARGRAEGMLLVPADPYGARRSFWAMAVCVPAVICMRLIAWVGPGMPPFAARVLGRDLLMFAVGWLAFAVLSFHLAPTLERAQRWPRFIATWNWCNVVENLLLVLGSLPGLFGAPQFLDQAAQVFTIGWALWLEWYATRLAFGVGPFTALGLLVLDESIGIVVAAIGLSMGTG